MPVRIPEESLAAIEKAVAQHPEGASFGNIAEALPERLADRTLQYRLRYLVDRGRLVKEGEGRRWRRYRLPAPAPREATAEAEKAPADPEAAAADEGVMSLSAAVKEIRRHLSQPVTARKPVGYNREFLQSYRPNETFYLSEEQRAHLAQLGKPNFSDQTAGTYAK